MIGRDPRAGQLDRQTDAAGVAEALDRARVLVLPSRSRGHGPRDPRGALPEPRGDRQRRGGIADLVRDGENGAARPDRAIRTRSPRRWCACSPTARSPSGWARRTRAEVEPLARDPRGLRTPPAGARRRGRWRGESSSSSRSESTRTIRRSARRCRRSRRWPSASTSSSSSPTRAARRAAGELPRAHFGGAVAGRPRRALRRRARRASCPRPAAVVAHMCPIYAVLAAPVVAAASASACCSGSRTGARRACSAWPSACRRGAHRRPALVPARLEEGSSRSATGSTLGSPVLDNDPTRRPACGSRSGDVAGEGARDGRARGAARLDDGSRRLEVHGPSLTPRSARTAASSSGSSPSSSSTSASSSATQCCAARCPTSSPAPTSLVNNMRAGAIDKVVYEACRSCVRRSRPTPASTRWSPGSSRRFASTGRPGSLADRLARARAAPARGAPQPRPRAARAGRRATTRSSSGRTRSWRRRAVTTVLHVQKVGISGSENHLLSLLPGLRARGWDARMLDAARARARRGGVRA